MTVPQIYEILKAEFTDKILELDDTVLQPFIKISAAHTATIGRFLRDDERLQFDYLMCLSGLDLTENLGVVYHFYSMVHNHKLVVHTEVSKEKPEVSSVAMLWRTADWHEREAYDMLGIRFIQHPDLKRILLPDDWTGFPLRKDYKQPEFYNGIRVPHPDQKEEIDDSE